MISTEDYNKLLIKYPNLRCIKDGWSKINKWTLDNLKDGFQYFFDINGRYPTTKEINTFEFLISARQMERTFGGVVNIRKQLGIKGPSDYTKGKVRSLVAGDADKRARIYEEEFYKFLVSKVEEVRVHEHKVIRPGNISCDFFIYTSGNNGIVIDLFYAMDLHSLSGILNIKSKVYASIQLPIYFVLVNNFSINQEEIDKVLSAKKNPLASNMSVITENYFKQKFDDIILK